MADAHERVEAFLERHRGGPHEPHFAAFFDCFNAGLFFEAHEMLEVRWLPARGQPDGNFYKALIQLAGAFVHCRKARLGPAAALFRLAATNLAAYPPAHLDLDVAGTRARIVDWLADLETRQRNPLAAGPPRLALGAETGREC